MGWQWYQKGLILSDNSDLEVSFYQKAIELCPELVDAHIQLGHVYKNISSYELSIYQFEQARIEALANPKFRTRAGSLNLLLEPFINIGKIYRFQGNYELAINEFTKALELYPDSLEAQNNLQYIYKRLHKYDTVLSPHNRRLTNGIFSRVGGTTLPKGSFMFDIAYRSWHQEAPFREDMFDDPDVVQEITPAERKSDIRMVETGLRYGLTSDLTIGIIPKFFKREADIDLGATFGETVVAEVEGIGDTVFLAKYHMWGERKKHISLYNLLSIPTGDTEKTGGTDKVWRRIPLGSGSYDFAPGIAFSADTGPVIVHSNMHYLFTDGVEIGDEFRTNLAFVYQFGKVAFACLELNYRWRDDVKRRQHLIAYKLRPDIIGGPEQIPAGQVEINTEYTETGGHTLFISPGFKLEIAEGLKLELGMQIPVIKQDYGWAEETIFHFGLTKSFF